MFDFKEKNKLEEHGRSHFANDVCQLIVDRNNKCIIKSLEDIGKVIYHFDNHVRNIYELYDREIPLFSLYNLVENGIDNYDFTEEEYSEYKLKALRACVKYYGVSLSSALEWEQNNL